MVESCKEPDFESFSSCEGPVVPPAPEPDTDVVGPDFGDITSPPSTPSDPLFCVSTLPDPNEGLGDSPPAAGPSIVVPKPTIGVIRVIRIQRANLNPTLPFGQGPGGQLQAGGIKARGGTKWHRGIPALQSSSDPEDIAAVQENILGPDGQVIGWKFTWFGVTDGTLNQQKFRFRLEDYSSVTGQQILVKETECDFQPVEVPGMIITSHCVVQNNLQGNNSRITSYHLIETTAPVGPLTQVQVRYGFCRNFDPINVSPASGFDCGWSNGTQGDSEFGPTDEVTGEATDGGNPFLFSVVGSLFGGSCHFNRCSTVSVSFGPGGKRWYRARFSDASGNFGAGAGPWSAPLEAPPVPDVEEEPLTTQNPNWCV